MRSQQAVAVADVRAADVQRLGERRRAAEDRELAHALAGSRYAGNQSDGPASRA